MPLTDEDVRELQKIWKKSFNEEISEAEARAQGTKLVELFAAIAKPLPSELNARSTGHTKNADVVEAPRVRVLSCPSPIVLDIKKPERPGA